VRCAQNVVQLVPPPNRIVSIREAHYKLARYYDGEGVEPDQWEMYDLESDPEERVNLAFPGHTPTAEQSAARERLTAKLREVEATRLQPL
jgi:choline-sulfatase